MSRSAAIRSRSWPTGSASHNRHDVGVGPGDHDGGDPAVDGDVRHQARVGGRELGLYLLQGGRLTDPAAAVAVPALLADVVAQLRRAAGPSAECGDGSAACSTRSSVSSAAMWSSAGGRTGVTRATRARARSDHS